MNYHSIELHSHTRHSDGDFLTEELVAEANLDGYDILTITDHNTMSPVEEYLSLKNKPNSPLIVPGMEWTTFFGHMLVIGANRVVDWRKAKLETIDEAIREVKEAEGLVGIAHPFSIGSPICTGCHWDFYVEDYNQVDFIEVWNRTKPDESFRSELAYEMWIDLLKQGYRISCSAGRDWHRLEERDENTAVTYIGLEEVTIKQTKESLKRGNFYITLGPQIEIKINQNKTDYYMGDTLNKGLVNLIITLREIGVERLKQFGFKSKKLVIIQNEHILHEINIEENVEMVQSLQLDSGYLRVEVLGDSKGKKNQRLIICNPFYIL